MKTKFLVAAAVLLLFTGCSARLSPMPSPSSAPQVADSAMDYGSDGEYYEEAQMYAIGATGAQPPSDISALPPGANLSSAQQPAKVIQTATINLNTKKFDEAVDGLKALAATNDGYIEYANLSTHNSQTDSYRVYNITLRVPAEQYAAVKQQAESMGELINSSENAQNVSGEYYSLIDRLETRKTEEERVLAMIEKAVKIEDLLALETRLGQIRADIERFEIRMNNIDQLSAYATIHVYLNENLPARLMPREDFGGRLQNTFARSANATVSALENLAILLASISVPIALAAILAGIGLWIAYLQKKSKGRLQV